MPRFLWFSLLVLPGCLDPTQITLDITTTASCDELSEVGIAVGTSATIEDAAPVAKGRCHGEGVIGTLVAGPSGDTDTEVVFKVVTNTDGPLEACEGPDYALSCIVARRALRYLPQIPLSMPVVLYRNCAGVFCGEGETCVDGLCRSSKVRPEDCTTDSGCDDTKLPPPEDPPLEVGWLETIVGNAGSSLRIESLASTPTGRAFAAGQLRGSVPNTNWSTDMEQVFLAEVAADGSFPWSALMEQAAAGLGESRQPRVTTDGEALLFSADYEGPLDFDGEIIEAAAHAGSSFVLRLEADKEVSWVSHAEASAFMSAPGLAALDDGTVYLGGSFSGDLETGSAATSDGEDAFVMRVSPDGSDVETDHWTSPGPFSIRAMAARGSDIHAAASIAQNTTIGGAKISGPSAVLVKLADVDSVTWSAALAGEVVLPSAVAVRDEDGAIFVAGVFVGTISAGEQMLTSAGNAEAGFVWALDADGNTLWLRSVRAGTYAFATSIAITRGGNVVVGGQASGHPYVVGDMTLDVAATVDEIGFVASFSVDGAFRWVEHLTSSEHIAVLALTTLPDGSILGGGRFLSDVSLGGLSQPGNNGYGAVLFALTPAPLP